MPAIDLDHSSKMAVEEEISSVQHPKQAVNRLSKRLWDLTSAKFRDSAKELNGWYLIFQLNFKNLM
jgi:hypothetical protein